MSNSKDECIRVMTDDHAFRVIACDTTETCREITRVQDVRGNLAVALGEICTATVLLRETMAPNLRVQGIAKGTGGRGSLIGDAFPSGGTRGLAQVPEAIRADATTRFAFGPGSILQMMRSLPNGSVHQGIVDVAAAGGISQALMTYMQESEQVISVAAVGVHLDQGEVVSAGGYVVQLLPEAERPAQMIMTERLSDFPDFRKFLEDPKTFSADKLINELLFGMPFSPLGRSPLLFECQCSEAALLSALATLGREEIKSMIDDGKGLEITCDYCRKEYLIATERLRALLDPT